MLAIRGFYNQWRFGDAASFDDQRLLSLLARDVRAGSLVAFYLPDEAYVTVTLASADADEEQLVNHPQTDASNDRESRWLR